MERGCLLILSALLFVGCDTLKGPNQAYLAPAVEGRVVDAESGDPLPDVRVQRYVGRPKKSDPLAEKGAQRLMTVPVENSDAMGRFSIAPERAGYLLFEQPPVFEITLILREDTHQTLTTNIDLVKIRPVKTNNVLTLFIGDLPMVHDDQ